MLDKEEMVLKIEETKYKMINWLIKLKLWADRIESLASHRLGLNAILAAQIVSLKLMLDCFSNCLRHKFLQYTGMGYYRTTNIRFLVWHLQ
jgi:hypothetical protein